MFRSPLKTVTEKIKPVQSKSGISSLKFDRASDFKKFLGFIKTETKELEKIKLPKKTEIKPKKKRGGILGLLGLGLLGILGGGFDGENERTGSEGGTASQFNPGILLSKNIRKTQKNLGLSKSVKGKKSEYKKIKSMFKKAFPKPDKKTLLQMKETRKNIKIRIERLTKELELIKQENKKAQIAKQELLKKGSGLDDPFVQIYDNEIKETSKAFKKTRAMRDFEELRLEANKPIGSFNIEKLKITREILDSANVSFVKDGKDGFKAVFGKGFEVTDRKFVETVLKENPNAAEFFKKVQGLDPLLFDVPQGGTLFSKILGKDRGIKIENRMGIVRESLDDMFTGIGKKTKPIRDFFSPVKKMIGKTKIPGSGLIPFTKGVKLSQLATFGRKIAKPVDIGLTAITAPFQLGILENRGGLLNPNIGLDRSNIVTHVYDMFTHFYNAGVEGLGFDDAHKRLKISKPIDRNEKFFNYFTQKTEVTNQRKFYDAYNEEILEAREAKKLRDAVNANSNFNTSMLNNSSTQLPKSTPFSVQKVDGGEFNPPFDYSDMGTIDFSSAAILYKLNK